MKIKIFFCDNKKINVITWVSILISSLLRFADMITSPIFLIHAVNKLNLSTENMGLIMVISSIFVVILDYPTSHIGDKTNKLIVSLFGTICFICGSLSYGLANSFNLIILGVFFKSLGMAILSGTLRAWLIDLLKAMEFLNIVKKQYISYSTIISQFTIVLSLISCYFLLKEFNSSSVFILSTYFYLLASILIYLLFLYTKDYNKTILIKEISVNSSFGELIIFFINSIKNKKNYYIFLLEILISLFFIIFVTFWQKGASELKLESDLALITLISFLFSFFFSLTLPFIDKFKLYKKNIVIFSISLFSLIGLFLFLYFSIFYSLLFFVFVCFFQVINILFNNFLSDLIFDNMPNHDNSAKYYSLLSTISELVNAFFLFIILKIFNFKFSSFQYLYFLFIFGVF